MKRSVGVAALCAVAAYGLARQTTGQLAHTGRRISPPHAGVGVGTMPLSVATSPNGRWIVTSCAGFRQQLTVLDARSGRIVGTAKLRDEQGPDQQSLYYGIAFDHAGRLYASRGHEDAVERYVIGPTGAISEDARLSLGAPKQPGAPPRYPAGIALDRKGDHLFVAENESSVWTGQHGWLSVFDTRTKKVVARVATSGFPFAVQLVNDKELYVASERDDRVDVFDAGSPSKIRRVGSLAVGSHPTAMAFDRARSRLYVANANSDTVSVIDTSARRVIDTILVRPGVAMRLPGTTPTGLALSPSGRMLYVTLGDLNALAVVRVGGRQPKVIGYVPTGWYPMAAMVAPDGKALWVLNGKGDRARLPNRDSRGPKGAWGTYVLRILEGTAMRMPVPTRASLASSTRRVLADAYGSSASYRDGQQVVAKLGRLGVRHVIYVVKENRTYDQLLGDMKKGNGDPSLTMFGEDVTPNHHALVDEFVLFDNYYCCSDVSADGWTWSVAGMAPLYNVRNTPVLYSGRGRYYDFEGQTNGTPVELVGLPDVARAPGGYLWDLCVKKGLTYRNYGLRISNHDPEDKGPDGKWLADDNAPTTLALVGHTDREYGYGIDFADSDAWVALKSPSPKQVRAFGSTGVSSRIDEWRKEFRKCCESGKLPALTFLTLQRDHTMGTTPGQNSPRAMVADNDYALGELVETVSHSPFWSSTVIVVVEDDPQSGQDHVDCHRSICLLIGPRVQRHRVDHRFGNTASALRTIEALLGLPPLCQYDAFAGPLDDFTDKPDLSPYQAILPDASILREVNSATAYRSRDSARMPLRFPDEASEAELNDILLGAARQVARRAADSKRAKSLHGHPRPPVKEG